MRENVTYGIGGYDPGKPRNNVASKTVDNEDGTGTKFDYSVVPPAEVPLQGLELHEPCIRDRIAMLEAEIATLKGQ